MSIHSANLRQPKITFFSTHFLLNNKKVSAIVATV